MPRPAIVLLALPTLITAATALAASAHAASPKSYDGHGSLRVQPRTLAELEVVIDVAAVVLSDRIGLGPLDILVDQVGWTLLDASDIPYEVTVPDYGALVAEERARIAAAHEPVDFGSWFDDYKDLAAIDTYMDDLVALRPDIASVEVVGDSIEGREIRALRITGPEADRPGVMLLATQHAREWIAPMVAMCIADALVRDYEADSAITQAVENAEFFVLPVANPDGYQYSWDEDRQWRKNRRDGVGVDLNRNWGFDWGVDEGSSDEPESPAYRGTEAFSEPETAAIRDYMLARPSISAEIDLHSFSQLILFPWGCRQAQSPHHDALSAVADDMAEAILAVHGETYQAVKGADWYPACGTAPDWAHDALDAFSFTIELRPDSPDEGGVSLPPEEIVLACEEILPAVLELAAWAADPDGGDTGTDTDSATTTDSGGASGGSGSGTTTATDEPTGSGGGSGSGGETTTEDPGGQTETDEEDSGTDSGTSESGEGEASDDDRGCSCTAEPTRSAFGLAALVFVAARRRKRR